MNEQKRAKESPDAIKGYMTKEKAIELLNGELQVGKGALGIDYENALKWGIHALQLLIDAHLAATRVRKP